MARSCKSNKYGMHGHCMLGGGGGATGWVGLTRSRQLKDDRELWTSKITIVGVYSTTLKRSPYVCTMYMYSNTTCASTEKGSWFVA